MKATHAMAQSHARVEASMAKLSTGSRINSAGDDAAGLATSVRLESFTRSSAQYIKNASDAVSMVTTADEAVSYLVDLVQQSRELVVLSKNGTNSSQDKNYLNAELTALKEAFKRTCEDTQFNGIRLFGDTQNCETSLATTSFILGEGVSSRLDVNFKKISSDLFAATRLVPEFAKADSSGVNSAPLDPMIDGEVHLDAANHSALYSEPDGVAISDFNGDGLDDIAFTVDTPDGFNIKLLLGDGHGAFSSTPSNYGRYDFPVEGVDDVSVLSRGGLSVLDVNDDGSNDLVYWVSRDGHQSIETLINDGTGSFSGGTAITLSNRWGGVQGSFDHMATGDLNGDCHVDILGGLWDVFINDGDQTFSEIPSWFSQIYSSGSWAGGGFSGANMEGYALLDIDADGDLDAIQLWSGTFDDSNNTEGNYGGVGVITYAENSGDGTFGSYYERVGDDVYIAPIAFNNYERGANEHFLYGNLAVGDVNQDGKQDIVVGRLNGVDVLYNVGTEYKGGLTLDSSIEEFDTLMETLLEQRATYGATINRLTAAVDYHTQSKISHQQARSVITDTNYATEVSNLAAAQIIHQASSAMLAQANTDQVSVLTLLRDW